MDHEIHFSDCIGATNLWSMKLVNTLQLQADSYTIFTYLLQKPGNWLVDLGLNPKLMR